MAQAIRYFSRGDEPDGLRRSAKIGDLLAEKCFTALTAGVRSSTESVMLTRVSMVAHPYF